MHNVKDFGAVGDGIANDTKAIQAAIDAGGPVTVPPGTYITGSLYLKSNGGLHLEAGAVLRASHDPADYNADDFCVQQVIFKNENVTGRHLIIAVEQENIFLSGEGLIDGDAFFWRKQLIPNTNKIETDPQRPGQLVFICECRHVEIRDIHMLNAPYWHLLLHGCDYATVRGVHINGEHFMHTNDGIDIDCCRQVTVSDCVIDTGDDAITLRAHNQNLKDKRPCENVVISNCVLTSFNDNAIRIGVGSGIIRNCQISNVRITGQTRTGFCFISRYSPNGIGCDIENIQISNVTMSCHRPFNIKMANWEADPDLQYAKHIRNITFTNIYAESDRCCHIISKPLGEISRIRLTNCEFLMSGHGCAPERNPENDMWGYQSTDSVFTVKHVKDLVFDNVRVRYQDDTEGWHHDVYAYCCKNVKLKDCEFPKGAYFTETDNKHD